MRRQRLPALPSRERLESVLRYLLDESEFLSPHGIRSVSRVHHEHPYDIHVNGDVHRVDYAPAEGTSGLFGGNSNWRGPRYEGGIRERDGAYHQGTAWPWLLGPFVDAWIRVRGSGAEVRAEARRRFFQPLLDHLSVAGVGHISEIADAEPPHTPRGCPFQAWSVGEALRLDRLILGSADVSQAARRQCAQPVDG